MKRNHRKSHIIIWLLLAPVLVGVILLAVNQRPPAPQNDLLPDPLIAKEG